MDDRQKNDRFPYTITLISSFKIYEIQNTVKILILFYRHGKASYLSNFYFWGSRISNSVIYKLWNSCGEFYSFHKEIFSIQQGY